MGSRAGILISLDIPSVKLAYFLLGLSENSWP